MDPARDTRLTPLLSNETLARAERLRIATRLRRTSKLRGMHVSRRLGQSLEFRDHRDYAEGDDVRFLDWNAFARLRRPYVKLFHEEEQQTVLVLVDASRSMAFDGKLELAKSLAAVFAVAGLAGGERVRAASHGARGELRRSPLVRGRARQRELLAFLAGIGPGGDAPLEVGIETLVGGGAAGPRGRGVLVLLSDFLTAGSLGRALNLASARGLEPFALQVLGPGDLDPALEADARLVDSETGATLDVTAAAGLLALYDEHRQALVRELGEAMRRRGGRFASLSSERSVEDVVFGALVRQGWLG